MITDAAIAEAQTPLPTDPTRQVQNLIEITTSLNTIFEQENDAFTSKRADDVTPLQAEKARLAAAYATSIQLVAANRHAMSAVDASLLTTLREITSDFEAHALRQRDLLDTLESAN